MGKQPSNFMKLKTLVLSILGICIIAAAAYAIFSPLAKRAELAEYENMQTLLPDTISTEPASHAPEPSVQNVPPVQSQPSTHSNQPPAPALAPVPTPTPAPSTPGYTTSEVALHSSASSCWTIINNEVYDLTSYVSKHPGGSSRILKICGKDGTALFEGQHQGESKPENILAGYKIGPLK